MKNPNSLFFAIISVAIALLSGCAAMPGEGQLVGAGNVVYESPTSIHLGGRHAVCGSLDNIVIANDSAGFVDFYEQARIVFQGIPAGEVRQFHPNSPSMDFPVAFRSVAYTIDARGNRVVTGTTTQIIRVNSMNGAVTVAWNVNDRNANVQWQHRPSNL